MDAPTAGARVERRDFYVYRIDNLDGVPVYIGKGRQWRYRDTIRRGAAIKAAIKAGLTRKPVMIHENLSEPEAYALETHLIVALGRADLGRGPLLNRSDGPGQKNPAPERRAEMAAARRGKIIGAETRAKLSAINSAPELVARLAERNKSPEMRAAVSAAQRGKPKSPEHVARIAEANRGRKASAETSAKLSIARRGGRRSEETRAKIAASVRRWRARRREAAE
jgi:hypothetical protein